MTTPATMRSTLVLASASPRRHEILASLGFRLVIDPSSAPEPGRRPGEPPSACALRLARSKAREVAARHPRGLIVGADTIVAVGDRILGKPRSDREARGMLRSLSGRWHEVLTGVCVQDNLTGRSASACTRSRVHMRPLGRRDIEWYLSTGEHRDKAGGYAIQGYASLFIDRIEGCYFNIVGFPVYTFWRLCRRLGVAVMVGPGAGEKPSRAGRGRNRGSRRSANST